MTRTIDINLTGLTKAEALVIAKEAFLAEANAAAVRCRLSVLHRGHSFAEIGAAAEIHAEMIEEELRVYLAGLAAWLDPPRPKLRLVHGAG